MCHSLMTEIMTIWIWSFFNNILNRLYLFCVFKYSTVFNADIWNFAECYYTFWICVPDIMNQPWKLALRFLHLLNIVYMSHLTHWTSLQPGHFDFHTTKSNCMHVYFKFICWALILCLYYELYCSFSHFSYFVKKSLCRQFTLW